jgi:hypothetical protein
VPDPQGECAGSLLRPALAGEQDQLSLLSVDREALLDDPVAGGAPEALVAHHQSVGLPGEGAHSIVMAR